MGKSRLHMSPAVKRALDETQAAAEFAAACPVEGSLAIQVIRGYIRSDGRWYVEVLENDNPEVLVLDGPTLVQKVRAYRDALDKSEEREAPDTGGTDL